MYLNSRQEPQTQRNEIRNRRLLPAIPDGKADNRPPRAKLRIKARGCGTRWRTSRSRWNTTLSPSSATGPASGPITGSAPSPAALDARTNEQNPIFGTSTVDTTINTLSGAASDPPRDASNPAAIRPLSRYSLDSTILGASPRKSTPPTTEWGKIATDNGTTNGAIHVIYRKDVESDRPLRDFSARIFDVSRVVGKAIDLELLTRFYAKLHPELRQLCRAPVESDERSKYVNMVDSKRKTLREKLKAARTMKDPNPRIRHYGAMTAHGTEAIGTETALLVAGDREKSAITPTMIDSDPKGQITRTDKEEDSLSEEGASESDESTAYYAEIIEREEDSYLVTEAKERRHINFAINDGQVIEAIRRPDFSNQLGGKALTHLRILLTFEGTKEAKTYQKNQEPKTLSGIGRVTNITKSATFDFYLPGTVRGKEVKAHFTVTADIVDQLTPHLLLGIGFLYEHGAKVDFVYPSVSFRSAHSIIIRGEIFKKRISPLNRVVKSAYIVTVKKGETAFIPVTYKNLPATYGSDRSEEAFHFQGKDKRFFNSIIDRSTPRIVIFHNTDGKDIQIHRRQLIGHISNYEGNETANFIASGSGTVDFLGIIGKDFRPGEEVENVLATGTLPIITTELEETIDKDDPIRIDAGLPNYGISRPKGIPSV
ncbi:uncharacterized protein NECHADRAFT_76104 [Fusarium vanettenii 77-13-4]|uniref:Uncharacterized protein n=1 Tax=Fusarium vanettenii (strain ATCC MYA-4622 / CBS 123669 / FGSC 9596 / NRRL 45880 / 77-13-4) TaxID=660122 RepID=C7Z6H6_FUSV7|nr:uncharacterized protein NECHADRAFT_76104 [Fusarium vanettenii 77-13-4]EEU40132.1 predicted protein [Fusarium vanettenii 77-13-4]